MKVLALVCVLFVASKANLIDDVKHEAHYIMDQSQVLMHKFIDEYGKVVVADLIKGLDVQNADQLKDIISTVEGVLKESKEGIEHKVDELQKLSQLAHELMRDVVKDVTSGNLLSEGLDKVHKELDEIWENFEGGAHDVFDSIKDEMDEYFQVLVEKYIQTEDPVGLLNNIPHRRLVKDFFASLKEAGGAITDAFRPHVDALVNATKTVHKAVKDHASSLWSTLNGHLGSLGEKLAGHLGALTEHGKTLFGHGSEAASALTEIAKELLSQGNGNKKEDGKSFWG